ENAKPISIGGGTYARVLKRGCGFGPQFEADEVTIHKPDEYISLTRIKQLAEIYYLAFKELTK
ncbi:MAG: dipeptidase PepV, partial [Clostridia bacterium]|nr:dipeptidase PepV [Clostridia bacterium]